MHIAFENIVIKGLVNNLNLEFDTKGCTVLYDPCEIVSSTILSALIGLYELDGGNIYLDGIPKQEYFLNHSLISTFSMIFNEGIMLANLTVKENLLLPYHRRFQIVETSIFEKELKFFMQVFNQDIDLELRPAFLTSSQRKFFCFIRSLLLKPKILLIDDPYYLFNRNDRKQIYDFLKRFSSSSGIDIDFATKHNNIQDSYNYEKTGIPEMLISTSDEDFTDNFATQVIDLSQFKS